MRAWKAITDAANVGTAFSEDYPLLVKIKEIRADATKQSIFKSNTIADFQQFLRIYATNSPCNTCPMPADGSWTSRFPNLDEILNNTIEGYQHHDGKLDFTSSFLKGEALSGSGVEKRDGGQHMLKYMADNSYTDNAIWIDRKFSYVSPQIINQGKEFDIYLGNANPNAIWFVECKSYAETTPIDVDQFIAYLSEINSLSNLRYVFNAKKLTLQQAKEKMQTVFRNNATAIFNALNSTGKFQQ
nr:hypothetical protein [Spirosomataceae bacterium]